MDLPELSPPRGLTLNDSGQLSIDFIVGFAIFMSAFIMVTTMSSGLLVGLQSRHVDYDAVAYRAGVLLSEDPGINNSWPGFIITDPSYEWEFIGKSAKIDVKRFGLSLYKSTPRILSEKKVRSFSDTSIYNELKDYHDRVVFGDYPYNLYINFTPIDVNNANGVRAFSIGNPPGQNTNYGYIRRVVMVKTPGEFAINLTEPGYLDPGGTGNGKITIHLDSGQLYDLKRGPVYWTDLMKERIRLRFYITNISAVTKSPADGIDLITVAYGYYEPDKLNSSVEKFIGPIPIIPPSGTEGFTMTGDGTQSGYTLTDIKYTITTEFDAGYFIKKIPEDLTYAKIDIVYSFDPTTTYIHSDSPIIFRDVPPVLVPAVLEVMVW